ncbi:MAG: cadmium-translocating P-type ATPase [Gemmatimonadales bacterium]|nr:cadmium-translocating P-type ATPase [Gemmatimonadales bacterium]
MSAASTDDKRPSPWTTPFAIRAYAAGILWLLGVAADAAFGAKEPAGWLAIRLDLAGLLFTAASVIGGMNFFGTGFRALLRLRLDMNSLMSIAIVAAILIGEPFEAATLAFLFSVAELLERYAVDRSNRSVAELLKLTPEQAERLRPDSTTETIAARELRVGDRVRIRPGDRIGADGRIVAGTSAINEATLTGESMPKTKGVGEAVFSGTLNLEGSLDIEVTADASHSVMARMVALVREAQSRRAPIEYFVQRFARIYTPAVTVLALLVAIIPPILGRGDALEWFVRALTLLVVACPCALVIATPVTVVSALTSAARHGVLIKGGEYLEKVGSVRALATDKTGTLTLGRLAVSDFKVLPPQEEVELLQLLAAVEARSEHPIGKAITRYSEERGINGPADAEAFRAIPGQGIKATVNGTSILVGTPELVGETAASLWGHLRPGLTWIFVEVPDRGLSARIGLTDEIRPEAAPALAELQMLGVRPIVMLTGDNEGSAQLVAHAVGLDQVRARLRPEQKVAAVEELRIAHKVVAMIGDGVNDAPSLAAADVGIAMGVAGSPAAIETADVALMADDLRKLPYTIRLARRAKRTIRINIALAIGLKLLLAAGALSGQVRLAVAVLVGDLGASLVVTINALRLASVGDESRNRRRSETTGTAT